jgi:hypothetical protein
VTVLDSDTPVTGTLFPGQPATIDRGATTAERGFSHDPQQIVMFSPFPAVLAV